MDEEVKRIIYAATLIIGVVLISFLIKISSNPSSTKLISKEYTVTELIQNKPLDKNIVVYGNISEILKDYTSKKGNTYQRFMISDKLNKIMVFCSTYKGKKEFHVGNRVKVGGKFQKYKEQYEIYSYCSNVQKLS